MRNSYYVQIANDPYHNLSSVIKLDGTQITNSPNDFPPPIKGKLGKFEVEIQNQSAHLADILRKRSNDTSHSRHDQDIANIQVSITKKMSSNFNFFPAQWGYVQAFQKVYENCRSRYY